MLLRPLSKAAIKKQERQIREEPRPRFEIECFYRDFDRGLDREIERLAKRELTGSGMSMISGLRDLSFDGYASEAKALAAARRIKGALPEVRVMLRSFKVAR